MTAVTSPRRAPPRRKVYFSGSIRGGRQLQPLYARIVAFLQDRGHDVLTAHVADPDVVRKDWGPGIQAKDIYARDLQWLAACDVLVAEVSTPSLGVGVELAEAQHLGKPVICLCASDVALSAMVSGNAYYQHIRYRDEGELFRRLAEVLAT